MSNDQLPLDLEVFELLIHLLELSVVLGIGIIVYITKKYPKKEHGEKLKETEDDLGDLSKR